MCTGHMCETGDAHAAAIAFEHWQAVAGEWDSSLKAKLGVHEKTHTSPVPE